MSIEKYGTKWPDKSTPIQIEWNCIRKGGTWEQGNVQCGAGLFQHYLAFQKLAWPWKDWHKWNLLILEEIVRNNGTGLLGPASSGKTSEVASYILTDYWCFPENTTALVSSTTLQMLDLRIWGELKKLFKLARELHPKLAGHLNESKHRISTAAKSEEIRDFRNGIQGVACNKGGTFVGLSNYAGIKNERLRIAGDELQFVPRAFIEAFNNLSKTPRDFKAMGMGNPKDSTDALGVMCEPKDGWDSADRSEKTKTWDCRMPGFRCVQLVGTDSPNYEFEDGKERFPYLIKRRQIEEDRKYYGPTSLQFAMMDLGMMPLGGVSNRVITRAMCENNHALKTPIFLGDVTKVYAIDAAYGSAGGDRCVAGELWFGKLIDGPECIALHGPPIHVPVNFRNADTPENQIAQWVKKDCTMRGIDPANVFYDSTGRGSLGTSFGRIWSTDVNPVEFGGKASDRPVSAVDRRPCHAAYGKFVTELWYTARLLIENQQLRGLTEEVVTDGQLREYYMIDGKKLDVEPKAITKKRMGMSPDIFDMLVTGIEGCRRRGFVIARHLAGVQRGPTIWQRESDKYRSMVRSKALEYA